MTSPSTWEAALAGTSGARTLDHDWVEKYDLPVTFAAEVAVPAEQVLSRTEARRLDPAAQMRDDRGPRGLGGRRHP